MMRALILAERRLYHPGDVIAAVGSPVRDIFILTNGEIDISLTLEGERFVAGNLSGPEVWGEESFLAGIRGIADITAVTEAEVYIIKHDKLYNDGVDRIPRWFSALLQVFVNIKSADITMQTLTDKIREFKAEQGMNSTAPAVKPLENLNVLVVEDDSFNLDLARKIFEKHGHNAWCAINGLEALELLTIHNFDLILMDLQMPVMGGVEAARFIRICESDRLGGISEHRDLLLRLHGKIAGGHVPIIAMTANNSEGDAEKCLAVGMDCFIAKPFRLQHALTALQKALSKNG